MANSGQEKTLKTYPRNLWITSCISFYRAVKGAEPLIFYHIAYFLGMTRKLLYIKNKLNYV